MCKNYQQKEDAEIGGELIFEDRGAQRQRILSLEEEPESFHQE